MQRTVFMAVGLGAVALAAAGCHPAKMGERRNEKPFVVGAALDCPESQGALSRQDVAADGRSCRYAGPDGEQVSLRYVSLDGRDAQTALAGIEQELRAAVPGSPGHGASADEGPDGAANAVDADRADDGDDDKDVGGDRTDRADRADRDDKADVDLPGLHIHANGDKAQINFPGVHINADGNRADVQVNRPGGRLATVHADEGGAEIHTGDIGPKNVDAGFILASDQPGPNGDKKAGYVARGPVGGPLIVAVETARGDRRDEDGDHDGFHDARRLVTHNVSHGR